MSFSNRAVAFRDRRRPVAFFGNLCSILALSLWPCRWQPRRRNSIRVPTLRRVPAVARKKRAGKELAVLMLVEPGALDIEEFEAGDAAGGSRPAAWPVPVSWVYGLDRYAPLSCQPRPVNKVIGRLPYRRRC